MRIKSKSLSKSTLPSVTLEFPTNFEQQKFISFVDEVDFDGLNYFHNRNNKKSNEQIKGFSNEQEIYAVWYPIKDIHTDPKRFQNRTDAFSELSAEAVSLYFDKNKFDPIVIWDDPNNNKTYVLSGHSRLEGIKRRKEDFIPARFFEGTESEAIKFARVDANRSTNKESLTEDLKAYKLMRDGDDARNIKPASKAEIHQAFKGKQNKLESLSYLNPKGKFIEVLSHEDGVSQFNRVQSFAVWVGLLRKEHAQMTNLHEEDCFNFLYGDIENNRIKREDFENLVKERLAYGKSRLFPECKPGEPCEKIKDFKEVGEHKELYKMLAQNEKYLEEIQGRFNAKTPPNKLYTNPEKQSLMYVGQNIKQQQERIKKDLNILEEMPTLFGIHDQATAPQYKVSYYHNRTNGIETMTIHAYNYSTALKETKKALQMQGFKNVNILEVKEI